MKGQTSDRPRLDWCFSGSDALVGCNFDINEELRRLSGHQSSMSNFIRALCQYVRLGGASGKTVDEMLRRRWARASRFPVKGMLAVLMPGDATSDIDQLKTESLSVV